MRDSKDFDMDFLVVSSNPIVNFGPFQTKGKGLHYLSHQSSQH
jgi:hypothetical protein